MKIVLINGSHRQGNTEFMIKTVHDEIKTIHPDHNLTLINLRQKDIGPATQTDYNCYETEGCADCCRDDMKEIFSLIEPCDLIIFGSPIYFCNVSGKMKDFMDRCHAYYFNKKLNGKQMVVIGVGATENNKEYIASWNAFASVLGMSQKGFFYAQGANADAVQNDIKTVESLKEFAKITLSQCKKLA